MMQSFKEKKDLDDAFKKAQKSWHKLLDKVSHWRSTAACLTLGTLACIQRVLREIHRFHTPQRCAIRQPKSSPHYVDSSADVCLYLLHWVVALDLERTKHGGACRLIVVGWVACPGNGDTEWDEPSGGTGMSHSSVSDVVTVLNASLTAQPPGGHELQLR